MNEKMSLTASLTESFKGLKKTKSLVFCALMLALQVILGNVTSIQLGPTLRISFQYLASAATGLLLGPGPALLAAAGADLIGFLIRPMGTYFFGFTLSAAVSGLIYGLFFYRRDVRLWRVLLAKLLVTVLVYVAMNTLWLEMLYGDSFMVLLPARLLKNLIQFPVDAILLYPLMKILKSQEKRLGL